MICSLRRSATIAALLLLGTDISQTAFASNTGITTDGIDKTIADSSKLQIESETNGDRNADATQYKHFVAHNATWTCAADEHATPFNNQIRGVNLGGWMVLEPWITPSLFYQFLSQPEGQVAIDTYTFCEVLGAEEANRQLRRHWDTWVTEDIIRQLAESGAVNSLRLPVGDFMYEPYGPYVGCTDGATDYVEDLLDWAHEYGLTVLIDIHAMKGEQKKREMRTMYWCYVFNHHKFISENSSVHSQKYVDLPPARTGSQNGFDNSGKTLGFEWTSTLTVYPRNLVTFQHWPIRTAEWMGTFDRHAANYSSINHDNINHSLRVISKIVDAYSGHPAVLGLQPVNEPWEQTPIEHLQSFYWEGYLIVKKHAPYWKYIMHDSFRFDPNLWGGFMSGCPDRALDTHIYQAWLDPGSHVSFFANACQQKKNIAAMETSVWSNCCRRMEFGH